MSNDLSPELYNSYWQNMSEQQHTQLRDNATNVRVL